MSEEQLIAALRDHPLFGALDPTRLREIVRNASELHVAPGDLLYTSGHDASHVFILLSGSLQIEFPPSAETRGPVVAMLSGPAFLGECQALNGAPWTGTGVALTDLVVLALGRGELLKLIEQEHEFTRRLYLELTRRYLSTLETLRHQPSLEPASAIARYLLSLRSAQGLKSRRGRGVPLALGQAQVGQATGLRRETVNRAMSHWVREGWITVDKSSLTLLRPTELERIAAAAPDVELTQWQMASALTTKA